MTSIPRADAVLTGRIHPVDFPARTLRRRRSDLYAGSSGSYAGRLSAAYGLADGMPHGHGRCTEIFRPPTAGPVRRGSIMRASFGGVLDRAEGLRRMVSGCKRPAASGCRFGEAAGSSISTEYSRETIVGKRDVGGVCRFVASSLVLPENRCLVAFCMSLLRCVLRTDVAAWQRTGVSILRR